MPSPRMQEAEANPSILVFSSSVLVAKYRDRQYLEGQYTIVIHETLSGWCSSYLRKIPVFFFFFGGGYLNCFGEN